VYDTLVNAIMIASGAVAVWCYVPAARDRWVGHGPVVAAAVVELALIVAAVAAVVRLADGQRPHEFATYIGYLIASVVVLPLAAALALMERTRWGSIVLGSGALVMVVLMLRLRQVWHG
jgi:hypothetical protein